MTTVTQRTSYSSIIMGRFLVLLFLWLSSKCCGYPLIAEVPEDEDKCFRFNIPEDDDAHMVFVALPSHVDDAVEEWFVGQVNELIQARTATPKRVLPKKWLNDIPEKIQKSIDDLLEEHGDASISKPSGIKLSVDKPRRPSQKAQDFYWFKPIVMNHVARINDDEVDFDSGYAICFQNHNEEDEALVIFDIVLVSWSGDDEDKNKKDPSVLTKEHLTPLEENLQESIEAANSILSEMRYMEKREARMRQTADSINSKVRLFSWLSVIILLSVTYVQVTYLKGYFRKKKLM